jgi:hypothetical protein
VIVNKIIYRFLNIKQKLGAFEKPGLELGADAAGLAKQRPVFVEHLVQLDEHVD